MDPSITIPLILGEWVGTEQEYYLRPLVGRLMQGILASSNVRYQQEGLHALQSLASVAAERTARNRDRLVTAMAAYAQLGDYTEAKAMERLGEIAIAHVVPRMTEVNQALRSLEETARDTRAATSKRRAAALLNHGEWLLERTNELLEEQSPYLLALMYAVGNLCSTNEPIEILAGTREWISRGGTDAGVLVAILFLCSGGIADRLETNGAIIQHPDGHKTTVSSLLFSLASGKKAIPSFSSFLADVYNYIGGSFSLPAELQHAYRERFAECLQSWVQGSLAAPAMREAVENLLLSLTVVRGGVMRHDVYSLFDRPAFGESDVMRSVSVSIRKRLV